MGCTPVDDLMGCAWVMPGNYDGGFDSCLADAVPPPGVYGHSTFHQGDHHTPDPHPAAKSSSCHAISTAVHAPAPAPTPVANLTNNATAPASIPAQRAPIQESPTPESQPPTPKSSVQKSNGRSESELLPVPLTWLMSFSIPAFVFMNQ